MKTVYSLNVSPYKRTEAGIKITRRAFVWGIYSSQELAESAKRDLNGHADKWLFTIEDHDLDQGF